MDTDQFRVALQEVHDWPCIYSYKFIVKIDQETELLDRLADKAISKRYSSSHKYVSVTAEAKANNPDEVIAVYRDIATIEGVIPL